MRKEKAPLQPTSRWQHLAAAEVKQWLGQKKTKKREREPCKSINNM